MDSLVASYASSDEEDEVKVNPKPSSNNGAGLFNSMPPPKSALFTSLPPPKSSANPISQPKIGEPSKPKSASSLFSSMPQPKSSLPSASSSNSKRVVQFRPPPIADASSISFDDDDEVVDEGEKARQRKKANESTSGASAFSLPAPRFSNSLGTLGGGRKSMFETVVSEGSAAQKEVVNSNLGPAVENAASQSDIDASYGYASYGVGNGDESNAYYGGYGAETSNVEAPSYDYSSVNYGNPGEYSAGDGSEVVDYSYGNVQQHVDYSNAGNSYVDYANNQQYENSWTNPTPVQSTPDVISELRLPMKRGRKDVMPQIIEVSQAELVKDRPKEVPKPAGPAFGPAYQPASTKGKPTKLHKRKHQISALYFDMRQKESELAERRSRGFQTKSQTQGKYGW